MTIERLTADQYPTLKGVTDGFVPEPANSIAIVAKDGADVVGRVLVVAMAHVEGTWVREDHRGGTLGARLYKRMEEEARKAGLRVLFAFCNPEHDSYMERLGYSRQPFSVWRKDFPCR